MSLENVQAFYKRLATDEAFRSQIQGVKSKYECSQIVKGAGYDFTQKEFEEYTEQLLESTVADELLKDLDEKELASVVGGATSVLSEEPVYRAMYGVVTDEPLASWYNWIGIGRFKEPIIQPMYGVVLNPLEKD
ncbi:Nif11-like leader peptide family natural product precursor [Iningainema tapete]|uniref:Nif11-like leader peptide family natural product n=1 Tax=Iningainema tapete BLCC-T55 TaxID=2748662 RepID=A0A8J6XJ47_9CYAN|nr:Nif11-like leader peptide family natural product precursor [Iningainema tapete]MBD2774085.1 Nif11-like leader peptide family natural product precursor [Iningainema tapete BLCC-T55]